MRCDWANGSELYQAYHDQVWGKETHDDRELFEMLVLESMQSGLSWATILNKQENFRRAFDNFEIAKVATYDDEKFEALMKDAGIIRHSLKIKATINNAKIILEIQKEYGSFDAYYWGFTNHEVLVNHWKTLDEVPSTTELSDVMSKAFKKRGFKFIGSTTIYSFMQATGMVNDHLVTCDYR